VSDTTTAERTFAFVDLAGFTALTEAHGDAEAVATIRAFRDRAQELLATGDELVKTIGDALMLAFPDPGCAVRALKRIFEAEMSGDAVLFPRAGAHHGPAVREDGDYFGQAVNLAARVAAQATSSQLLVTQPVATAARDEGIPVTHHGKVDLRNIADPVDLYDVRVCDAVGETAVDPVCAMRVPIGDATAVSLHVGDTIFWFCGLECVGRFAQNPNAFADRAVTP
jgi:class 3 adenylate cyclase/YHS domain-containing protein